MRINAEQNFFKLLLGVLFFIFFLFIFINDCRAGTEIDLQYMVEDFESAFESNEDVGFLPSGWSVYYDSGMVEFNQGADSHHGLSSLHADVRHHPSDYSIIEAVLSGEPGSTVDLRIQVKALPEDGAITKIRFAIFEAASSSQVTMTCYGNPGNEWYTITLDEIKIDSDGEFLFEISVAQTNTEGYADIYFDCLTSDDSNVKVKNEAVSNQPPPPEQPTVNSTGDGGGNCFIETLMSRP